MSWSIQMETASQLPSAEILDELQTNDFLKITKLVYAGVDLLDGSHKETVDRVHDALSKYEDFQVSDDTLGFGATEQANGAANGAPNGASNGLTSGPQECTLQYQRFDTTYTRTCTAKAGELLRLRTEIFRVYYDNVAVTNSAVYDAWMTAAREADGYYVDDDIMLRGVDSGPTDEPQTGPPKEAKVVFTVNSAVDWKERTAEQGRFLSLLTWEGVVRGRGAS